MRKQHLVKILVQVKKNTLSLPDKTLADFILFHSLGPATVSSPFFLLSFLLAGLKLTNQEKKKKTLSAFVSPIPAASCCLYLFIVYRIAGDKFFGRKNMCCGFCGSLPLQLGQGN